MALQASPRTQTAIPPDAFPLDAPPTRHHYGRQQPPAADAGVGSSSPRSPSGRHRRRPSGGSQPHTPQMASHRSPNLGSGSSGSTARPVTIQVSSRSPASGTSNSNHHSRTPEVERQIDGTVLPPRTSSHQRGVTATGVSDFPLPDRSIPTTQPSDKASSTSRAARDYPISPVGTPSNREHRASQPVTSSRSKENPHRPTEMSRDNSEILNRVVVTDPQEDLTRERERLAESIPARDDGTPASTVREVDNQRAGGQRTRQDFSGSSARRRETRFGDYILGQTLGEGEFGKVKLGWKRDGTVEVAIKMIRRESLNSNPQRLPKIYREINILQGLSHPNIVRLHEMVETERHIGIILEYASGGELFDYILTHRYLKDNAARRLFAQLVSGVGYLHKKGIVHRDLKLENLMLDRYRNIIITDFGFANTFDPMDELGEEIELNLKNRDFVKRLNLDAVSKHGHRRGDLMQTSCGSPCYAAPELVVDDSLYTGRKVDVWSCGVILYAMLAGYLPFDDDPANPEGDNINLLYKYIVSTPLTFPEYVSPHARDLLRRILVPDPRKRADLFEVARHSWLAEYAHVVAHVTSTTTTLNDLANSTMVQDFGEPAGLVRSASVREPTKPHSSTVSPVGGLRHGEKMDDTEQASRDAKRRTVQVEYVPPQSQTARGEMSPPATPQHTSSRDARKTQTGESSRSASSRKPVPQSPAEEKRNRRNVQVPPGGHSEGPNRLVKDQPRAVSEYNTFSQAPAASMVRPTTGGSVSSTGRLPSRGNSYGQPVAPTVAATNVAGSLAQPTSGGRPYNISAPIPHAEPQIPDNNTRPVSQRIAINRYSATVSAQNDLKGHKRANTFGSVFGRSGSLFGGRSQPQTPADTPVKNEKKYPPTSMKAPMAPNDPRPSGDARRPSFGFSRKNSDVSKNEKEQKQQRRFSLLPASFSLKSMSGGAKKDTDKTADSRPTTQPANYHYASAAPPTETREHVRHVSAPIKPAERQQRAAAYPEQSQYPPSWRPGAPGTAYPYGEAAPTSSEASFAANTATAPPPAVPTKSSIPTRQASAKPRYPQGFNEDDQGPAPRASMQQRRLHKPNRKFNEAWDGRDNEPSPHAGSTGAARRVMDFFRRRGKARQGEDSR